MTATASGFDPAKLPAKLRAVEVIEPSLRAPAEVADAQRFGEGQLSGPFGPQFVGYGPAPRPSLLSAFLTAAVLATISGAIIIARAAL